MLEILQSHGVTKLVKSKSMLTEECHLNPFLERHGLEVIDTDLGERIVQLRREAPSHIVLPAIHIKKEEVGELFHQHLGTEAGAADPDYLTQAACRDLRERFLAAEAGITGVNFAVAETGGIVVCTNEGNADLGVSLPKLHIACMGIEKLIPRAADLGVFLRLLARSATGQPITTYTSHFHGPVGWRGIAHRAGRQRPQRDPLQRRLPPVAQLHPLRRLHEYLSGVPPQAADTATVRPCPVPLGPSWRRPAMRRSHAQPALRLQPVRLVHGRLSGQDRPAQPTADLAAGDRTPGGCCRGPSGCR